MFTGILAGVTWALETVILGIALGMNLSAENSAFLLPLGATFLHDAFSSVFTLIYDIIRGNLKNMLNVFKNKHLKWLILSSAIGGPIGMTGYVMAVNYMGPSVGAVASAVYPAIGTVLAYIFLKERVKWYQWIFLLLTMFGVYGLSYSPGLNIGNFWFGLLGAFMCAFGWGIEAVILAGCMKDTSIKNECALWIRQTTSALIYGLIIIPALSGWDFTWNLLQNNTGVFLPSVAGAALFATISYLFYYRTIARIGASKAMALNITYTAWAIVFTVLIFKDFSVINGQTLLCAGIVVVCGVFAATDLKALLPRTKNREKTET